MASDAAARPAPSRLDSYRLVRRLASGGMAEVFLAVDERDGREVALKRILPHIAGDTDFRERFFHEIRIQIALKHRNVVELLDFNPGAGEAYIAMEYVDGGTLSTLAQKVGKLPWEVALFVAEEALRGLGAAHRKGIVHRDVKPQNIMWTKGGGIKIADFGVSRAEHLTRLTVTGTVVGTPSYMSPEQARGEPLDGRSDLFSMGTVLYELLTATNPFTADSIAATLRRVVEVDPQPPSSIDPTIPVGVDRIVRKLQTRDRDHRTAKAEEACEAIRALLAVEKVEDPAATFRAFTLDPGGFLAARTERLGQEKAARAQQLLADASAPPEEVLWAAYQTMAVRPDDPAARDLYRAAAAKAGQREQPVQNPRIRDLEEQLRRDPDNVAVLLQLAKLYRLEKDFLNVMKFFLRLRATAPPDPYTQGQIAALVSPPPGPAAATPKARSVLPAPAAETSAAEGRGKQVLLAVGLVASLAFGVWWLKGPARKLGAPSADDIALAESIARRRAAAEAPAPAPAAALPAEDPLQKVLEKGALLERDQGPAQAAAHYREALPRIREPSRRVSLLLTLATAAEKAGDATGATEALDAAALLGDPWRREALYRKGALLVRQSHADDAQAIFSELVRTDEGPLRIKALLHLADLADRDGDSVRALTFYEQVLAHGASAPEANVARLGAAGIYRAQGRREDARRLLEEVRRTAAPGSDEEKSALAGLKALE